MKQLTACPCDFGYKGLISSHYLLYATNDGKENCLEYIL